MKKEKKKRQFQPGSTCDIKDTCRQKEFLGCSLYQIKNQGSLKRSLCENLKVNPWDQKKMWNCLLNTQRVMEHIGFLPPAEDMFVVQLNHFFFNIICFMHFGCPIQRSETNKLWGKVCFTRLVYSVKWKKNKTGGKASRRSDGFHPL